MAKANMSDELKQFFTEQRSREKSIHKSIDDLKELQAFNVDIGKTDVSLVETITRAELEDQKLNKALTKRGF